MGNRHKLVQKWTNPRQEGNLLLAVSAQENTDAQREDVHAVTQRNHPIGFAAQAECQ